MLVASLGTITASRADLVNATNLSACGPLTSIES
jgi:hypothetical protein